jgi:predicted enzyme related to lactoylglutathione lyase
LARQSTRALALLFGNDYTVGELAYLRAGNSVWSLSGSAQEIDMPIHEKINYVEYPAKNLEATKAFFQTAFGWVFADYGPDYAAFSDQGIDGGFFSSEMASKTASGAALLVFYSDRLEDTFAKVTAAGGKIVKPIYSFPGGRRFHFTEPSGNEFAVWAEPDA